MSASATSWDSSPRFSVDRGKPGVHVFDRPASGAISVANGSLLRFDTIRSGPRSGERVVSTSKTRRRSFVHSRARGDLASWSALGSRRALRAGSGRGSSSYSADSWVAGHRSCATRRRSSPCSPTPEPRLSLSARRSALDHGVEVGQRIALGAATTQIEEVVGAFDVPELGAQGEDALHSLANLGLEIADPQAQPGIGLPGAAGSGDVVLVVAALVADLVPARGPRYSAVPAEAAPIISFQVSADSRIASPRARWRASLGDAGPEGWRRCSCRSARRNRLPHVPEARDADRALRSKRPVDAGPYASTAVRRRRSPVRSQAPSKIRRQAGSVCSSASREPAGGGGAVPRSCWLVAAAGELLPGDLLRR